MFWFNITKESNYKRCPVKKNYSENLKVTYRINWVFLHKNDFYINIKYISCHAMLHPLIVSIKTHFEGHKVCWLNRAHSPICTSPQNHTKAWLIYSNNDKDDKVVFLWFTSVDIFFCLHNLLKMYRFDMSLK